MKRLNPETLSILPNNVQVPQYDRNALKTGIVHLGIGAFHRAHQAYYIEALLNREPESNLTWGIVGASLRSASVREQLQAQSGLYTLVENSSEGSRYQIIGCIQSVLAAVDQQQRILQQLADPDVKIVSLTITEKGYCHDPATGALNFNHPDIQHDIQYPDQAKSAIGILVAAMRRRQQQGHPGFSLLSCDNLPSNGKVLKQVVTELAQQLDPNLIPWITECVSFPSSMIDRIVPATTEADKEQVATILGVRDEALVKTEPFTQWVVEDNFCRGRPAWEKVGVMMTDNVEPFEIMKLRLLNGAHSLIAYTGYLSGYQTVAEVMAAPSFRAMVARFMDNEASPSVSVPAGFNLADYKKQLLERFSNTALNHRTWQIAMDGSQKIPQRWLATLRYQLANQGSFDILLMGLAAWIRYVTAVDDEGNTVDVSDPWSEKFAALGQQARNTEQLVESILSIGEIFSDDLVKLMPLRSRLVQLLESYSRLGVRKTIEQSF